MRRVWCLGIVGYECEISLKGHSYLEGFDISVGSNERQLEKLNAEHPV
jgi:hypothetical protein